MTSPDPILDAEGHNKPLRRRGVFSTAETQALTTALGIRCVVYRDRSGSLPYTDAYGWQHGKLIGVDYIFVKGYNGRISTVGLLPPYYPEQSADVARKIRGILDDEAGRQERNRKVAQRSVVQAVGSHVLRMGMCPECYGEDNSANPDNTMPNVHRHGCSRAMVGVR